MNGYKPDNPDFEYRSSDFKFSNGYDEDDGYLLELESLFSIFNQTEDKMLILNEISNCLKNCPHNIDEILYKYNIVIDLLNLLDTSHPRIAEISMICLSSIIERSSLPLEHIIGNYSILIECVAHPSLLFQSFRLFKSILNQNNAFAEEFVFEGHVFDVILSMILRVSEQKFIPPLFQLYYLFLYFLERDHLFSEYNGSQIISLPIKEITSYLSSKDGETVFHVLHIWSITIKNWRGDIYTILTKEVFDRILNITINSARFDLTGKVLSALMKLFDVVVIQMCGADKIQYVNEILNAICSQMFVQNSPTYHILQIVNSSIHYKEVAKKFLETKTLQTVFTKDSALDFNSRLGFIRIFLQLAIHFPETMAKDDSLGHVLLSSFDILDEMNFDFTLLFLKGLRCLLNADNDVMFLIDSESMKEKLMFLCGQNNEVGYLSQVILDSFFEEQDQILDKLFL